MPVGYSPAIRTFDTRAVLAACERLPFFPLPSAVLFPGMQLPLHIFEPRYRQMIEDALAGHRAIAMALPLPGAGPKDPAPPVHAIAGMGWIAGHATLPDGRSNVLLQGVVRVRLAEIDSTHPYRIARAEPLADRDAPGESARGLYSLALQIAARTRRFEPRFELPLMPGLAPGPLCDHLACRLLPDPLVRQGILEAIDVRVRIERTSAALADVLHELLLAQGGGAGQG